MGAGLNCALCAGDLSLVHDFGHQALAGGFLKPQQFEAEKLYPLKLAFCESCYSAQVVDDVPADTLFRDYRYFSSATQTGREHFSIYAHEIVEQFHPRTVLEIGCNDGVMLKPLADFGVKRLIGVDPAANVVASINDDRIRIVNDYWSEKVAREVGKADVIIANNVFAHVPDLNAMVSAVASSLSGDGVFVMECHYLGKMIAETQYDVIYHEHKYYHSLIALEKLFARHGLMVFDVKKIPLHAGSMRYYVCHKGALDESWHVTVLAAAELLQGLGRLRTFEQFSERVTEHRDIMQSLMQLDLDRVAGYGAAGRANTLIQYCGMDLAYIVDDAPEKQGYYTPGSHVQICGRERLAVDAPDCMVLFAWSYEEEITAKCRLPMVVPFPRPHLLNYLKVAA